MSGRIHLFLAVPNNSGGTLLVALLASSQQATTFASTNSEGQWVARAAGDGLMPFPAASERRNWTVSADTFADPRNYDWERLTSAWEAAWDPDKPVRIEKTPSLVISAPLFQKRFADARFVLSVRNPYAFCEGVRRREGHRIGDAARHWLRSAQFQLRNMAVLPHALPITYEQLCERPREIADRIATFVPALEDIDVGRSFAVMDAEGPIRNRNREQIDRLSTADLEEINAVLTASPELLDTLDYELILPGGAANGTSLAMFGGTPVRSDPWPRWPRCDESTERAVIQALRGGRWALTGPSTGDPSLNRRFEDAFAAYEGVEHCVAVASGSAALHIALQSLDVGLRDEVLVPGLTWVACASAVLGVGAIPVLVDVQPGTLCMSLEAARAAITPRTRAILLVHAYCSVADLTGFEELSQATGIPLLEDCSQAHGAVYAGRRVGSFGTIGAFSMQQTKVLTSGEGGAVVTSDYRHYQRLQELRSDGRRYAAHAVGGALDIEEIGTVQGQNCAISELQCAILLDRLKYLDEENRLRASNAAHLDALVLQTGCATPLRREPRADEVTYYKYVLRVDRDAFMGADAAVIARALRAELRLDVTQVHPPIYRSSLYQPQAHGIAGRARDLDARREAAGHELPEASRAWQECVAVPHEALLGGAADMEQIARALEKVKRHAGALPKSAAAA